MSYQEAMQAAGAEVHEFNEFGSYQGDWWAKVTYNGQTGWVTGSYGSCSPCDAFEGEFGYTNHNCNGDDYYSPFYGDDKFRDGCETCQSLKERFIKFGQEYLECIMSQDKAEAEASENLEWDMDAQEMVDFLRAHSIGAGV